MISCINHYSKENHTGTKKITDGLFLEVYQTSEGGVFASDTFSKYLTDSVSFRKYIGYQLDDERIQVSMLDSNFVLVCLIDWHNAEDTIKMDIYSINQLKKKGKWE
jgi:hypothetical protein